MLHFENNIEFAKRLDSEDPLKNFREEFFIPGAGEKKAIYFCGNSLGLQPKKVSQSIQQELNDWTQLGVEGHMKAKNPWVDYHKMFAGPISKIVGAKKNEVVVMNSLTVNLHLMFTSFYRPTKEKYKILMEEGSFSSDSYAIESQVKLHGKDPEQAIVKIKPREGEFIIRHEDILNTIEQHGDELALVFIGGVNYYTGQVFEMKEITVAAHKKGVKAGFDLAHAVGNIELSLHDWGVDFAVWCTYKYLNSGPGAVGGLFVHDRYAKSFDLPRLAGWWGHEDEKRFLMEEGFKPMAGAEGWQLSNAPVLSMAAHKASLDIFEAAGMKALLKKSNMLTGYLEYLIATECKIKNTGEEQHYIKIITPKEKRGCQLSILIKQNGRVLFDKLIQEGFVVDWRAPAVIRVAPVPLYNTFEEVYHFGNLLAQTCCHE